MVAFGILSLEQQSNLSSSNKGKKHQLKRLSGALAKLLEKLELHLRLCTQLKNQMTLKSFFMAHMPYWYFSRIWYIWPRFDGSCSSNQHSSTRMHAKGKVRPVTTDAPTLSILRLNNHRLFA